MHFDNIITIFLAVVSLTASFTSRPVVLFLCGIAAAFLLRWLLNRWKR